MGTVCRQPFALMVAARSSRIDHASIDADKWAARSSVQGRAAACSWSNWRRRACSSRVATAGVCLGGYLLQADTAGTAGSTGPGVRERDWPGRHHRRRRADPREQTITPICHWVARGRSGAFGVVTSFLPEAYPRPANSQRLCSNAFDLPTRSFNGPRGQRRSHHLGSSCPASRGELSMGIDVPVISFASPRFR